MGKISSFGDPRPATTGTHMGTDFSATIGTPIYANYDLTVTRITDTGNYGLRVELKDSSGGHYELAHLDSTDLTENQTINAGDLVAYSGNSGNAVSTPPHTHFEYRPAEGGPGPSGTVDSESIDPKTGQPYAYAFGYNEPGMTMYDGGPSTVGQVADGYTPKQGSANGGTGGAASAVGGAASAVGGAAKTVGAGQEIGGAGCLANATTPAKAIAAGGLLGQLGGVAQGAALAAAQAALGGGGIQGIMGAALGSAGGALGNSLGAELGGAGGAFLGQTLGGSIGSIVAGQNPLQALSGSAFGALSQMGADAIPGLSNVLPGPLQDAAINGLKGVLGGLSKGVPVSAAFQMGLAGGLNGLISSVTNNMTGNYALGASLGALASGAINGTVPVLNSALSGAKDPTRFASLIQTAAAVSNNNRTMVGAIAEGMALGFGNGPGGLGAATRNMQDAMTFSITTLGQNINAVSTDLIAIGTWDATDLMRFMQPGNIATQILMAGMGDIIGLTDLLISVNVPVSGLDNPVFDRVVYAVLAQINDTDSINVVKTYFNMTANIKNLGEICDINKMMPNSIKYMPIKSFRELGIQLAVIGVSAETTVYDIGIAFSKVETATDLNYVSQMSQPLPTEVGNALMQVYGFGGGSLGEQTMADIIGTPAGYVHTDTIPVIVDTNKIIMDHPEAAQLLNLTNLLNDTLKGVYTDLGSPSDSTANPPVPGDQGSINIPGVGTFNTLDDAILAFIPLIEAEHHNLLNTTDPKLKDAIDKLNVAWNASCSQIIRENNNLQTHNIDIFNPLPPTPGQVMTFVDSLDYYGMQTGYGQTGHYLERVATADLYGDAIKYAMRQARNAAALENLGINTEKYKIPQSDYYRNPETFYTNLYTGNLPSKPQMQKAQIFPASPADVYLYNRDKKLEDMGMTAVPLLNNQKDEIYYDSLWTDTPQTTLNSIGESAVRAALRTNLVVDYPDLIIKDLTGTPIKFGEIANGGLLLNNNDNLVDTMLQLVNRVLYGANLLTTKYTNPFNTDQMVYGILELLAQININNIGLFVNKPPPTAGLIPNFLNYIQIIFQTAGDGGIPGLDPSAFSRIVGRRNIFDTSMDRNDPNAYGDSGPPAAPR